MKNLLSLPPGDTEAKKTSILDTFLDLGRNLVPDNLFQAAFQSVKILKQMKLANISQIKTTGDNFADLLN